MFNSMSNLMRTIRVELGSRSYDITFHDNDPDSIVGQILPFCPEQAFVISNETIWNLHGGAFWDALNRRGIKAQVALIGDGEKYKSIQSVTKVYDQMLEAGMSRRTCVIAFGGGVVGDLAGFVAATFLRGVNFVQVPTTVVAMVDSSVGGKTGVDHPLGKNLIGAFYQPRLVAIDTHYLSTLDSHNRTGGFAEVIKYGVIYDAEFFRFLEENIAEALELKPDSLRYVIARSCEIKAEVVSADEFEGGLRAILNYGHTFAHAIESVGEYAERQFHGQAVAIGMVAAAELAVRMGIFDVQSRNRIESLISNCGLPSRIPAKLDSERILDRMKTDKKVADGQVRFILPRRIGEVELRDDAHRELVLQVLRDLTE
jgi:3-dehydroquinate synthase